MSEESKKPVGKILVVDDDSTALLLMRAALRKSGFEATMASNGAEALRLFRADSFDVVMLDVSMPEMSGFEVCAAIRQEADASLPIVMVTGMDDVASVELAYQSGATDFISKPINWALIGHRARYLMRGHQALLQLRSANARNAAILQAIPDFLFEIDIDGRFLSAHSPRASLLSLGAEALPGQLLGDVLPADVAKICQDALKEALEQEQSIGRQFQLTRKDGSFWFELSVALKERVAGQNAQFIGLARDITQRKADEQKILRMAMFDNLTGLPNRQSFIHRIERENKRTQLYGTSIAV